MTDLWEYQKKVVTEIEDFIKTAGLASYEITEAFEEHNKHNPDFFISTWRQYIYDSKSVEGINKQKETLFKIINNAAALKRLKEAEKKKQENEEKKSSADLWNEYYKENADYWQKSAEWWKNYNSREQKKDDKEREKENKKALDDYNKNPPKKDDFDEKAKKEYIGDVELFLANKNVSGERLNQRLGVGDWREKISQATDWRNALDKSSDLKDIIRKLEYEYTCANCGVKKEEYTAYGVGAKKACSFECQKALSNNKDKGVDKDDATEIKKELQEIKDYLKNHNENANKVLNNLLTWMKNGGVVNITLSSDKLVVEFSDKKTKIMEESELNSEQRAVKNYLQSASGKKSIDRNELEKMVSGNYNKEGRNEQPKGGNVGTIVAICGVVLVLAFVIGVVVYSRNKKRDY